MATTTDGHASDDEVRAAIRASVDAAVRVRPDGDIHAVMIRQQLSRPDISNERVTAMLRGLANGGMLYEDRKAKVAGNDSAKDRKIIHYRATDVYKRHLGLLKPAPAVESAQLCCARYMPISTRKALSVRLTRQQTSSCACRRSPS